LANAGPLIADNIRRHLHQRIDRLRRTPQLGIASSEPHIRVLPAAKYPYRIYYTVAEDAVVILPIRHSARHDPNFADFSD
jgi:plasmid stabilization system protein ParE